ncbi:hypothetical protein M3P05_12850 [Sansalvadorimonas sp. 2012CJ34-2]|uniref:Multidrug transporter n=1 Tax=Parendozoicomonas callyspongiae TaxID=2942213 RepID=A0ABT0PHG0_9GAMM|nr:hypothetical protein [Sansalvadorimonas sp. 2012CJ34-2]MCL6270813.1 hypothetical protein [Sansalvadorimonas sp. 2012CJ34-2]
MITGNNTGHNKLRSLALALATAATLSITPAWGSDSQVRKENPSLFAMTGDLVLARPLMLATTLVGTAVFVVSSPFSIFGGNVKQSAETLVYDPFKATFVRCLGCSAHTDEGF